VLTLLNDINEILEDIYYLNNYQVKRYLFAFDCSSQHLANYYQ